MSFNFEQVRKFYQDPHLAKINEMSKKIAQLETDNIEIKTDDLVGRGDFDRSKIRLDDRHANLKKYSLGDDPPLLPNEPDYNFLKLHLKFWSMGGTLPDYSGFDNVVNIQGVPCPTTGIDQGLWGGSHHSAAHKNLESEKINYEVVDNSNIRIVGLTTGVSYVVFCNFKSLPSGGCTLFEKFDDANNQVRCMAEGDGQLKFIVKRAGTSYKFRTNAGGITTNTDYILIFTYTVADNSIHIYRNGTDVSLVTSSEGFTTTTDTNLNIGSDPNDGQYCDFNFIQDFRMYKEKVLVTDTHGASVFFDGVDDRVRAAADTDLWSGSLSKFSFSCWIYPTLINDGNSRFVVEHNSGVAHGWRCDIDPSVANRISFVIKDAANASQVARSTALQVNQWNHLICTYDNSLGSANIKIFINNVQGATTDDLTETLSNPTGGLDLASSSNDFKGYMRDFRFWRSIALDTTQRTNVINDSLSAPLPDYWLKLNVGSGVPTDFMKGKVTTMDNGALWILDHVGNIQINKLSISNIPFGRVAILDACVAAQIPMGDSFTSTSFTDTSFS